MSKLESEVGSLTAQLDEARARGESTEGSDENAGEFEAQIAGLTEKVEMRGRAIEQLAARVKAAEASNDTAQADEQASVERSRADDAVREMEQARQEVESLRSSLSERKADMGDEWTQSRRDRLRSYRGQLKNQSEKVRRASETLRDRNSDCEKLLSRRAELSSAYQRFNAERERMVKKEVRSNASLALAGIVGVLAIIGGVSWFIAGQVAPGRHVANATIIADGGRRTLTDGELEGWQTFTEAMVTDPAFLDTAADRMRQRGIVSLGTPGQLSQLLQNDLHVQSSQAGRVELELMGDGAVKTQRVLDTFVVSMSSHANESRMRRQDAATTRVAEPAKAMEGSLDKTRIYATGGIFLGGFGAAFGLGGLMWRKMAATKTNFERDQKIDSVLDDHGWVDPRKAA